MEVTGDCREDTLLIPFAVPHPFASRSMPVLNLAFWRKWHRWIGFPAALFLLWAASTGFLVAFTEFFGEEEALREATRDMVSPVTVASPAPAWTEPIARALATAATRASGAPVDKIEVQFKR